MEPMALLVRGYGWLQAAAGVSGALALVLSMVTVWRGRSRLKPAFTFVPMSDDDGERIVGVSVYNPSPHALEVIRVGVIQKTGEQREWRANEAPGQWRVDARAAIPIALDDDMIFVVSSAMENWIGCYVVAAGGKRYYSVGPLWRWRRLFANTFTAKFNPARRRYDGAPRTNRG